MASHEAVRMLSEAQHEQWTRGGYVVVTGLFGAEEVAELLTTFDGMYEQAERNGGKLKSCFKIGTPEEIAADPLHRYPRMSQPHRYHPTVRQYLLYPRVGAILAGLFAEEPLAVDSMFYWKPPQARGQALHQDNYYLRVRPGTCIAAWTALDRCDEQNGALVIVPGTQDLEVACPEEADPAVSFTKALVRPPAGYHELTVRMAPGDCLFFNGSIIHGSYPNRSTDRFRRSFICHYIGRSSEQLGFRRHAPLRFDGQEVAGIRLVSGYEVCGGDEFETAGATGEASARSAIDALVDAAAP